MTLICNESEWLKTTTQVNKTVKISLETCRKLYFIHTNKTCLIKPGLTKWNSATESWMISWNNEFKWAFTCFFICTKFAAEKDQQITFIKKTILNLV